MKTVLVTGASDGTGLDVLANNAGGLFGDTTKTVDGNEKTFQVNHLAPFLLTELILDDLRAGADGRASVINLVRRRHTRNHLAARRLLQRAEAHHQGEPASAR